ncbi:nucleoside deaminase [Kurthia gibsonii]|uniref:nucleoside deaminase n=1 Tax=Kurthia gibsonii TaxID=33946 RepID=UPI002DBD249A|nr:nucleoside deaminase [Kurthia gibsonii]MEB7773026.1 nucleoside deaminase [Kurthia gibsonii]
MEQDILFLRKAIELAKQAKQEKDEPFGALLVKDGVIVATGQNYVKRNQNPIAHAELKAIHTYCAQSGMTDLQDYTLYSSCEPCPMCLSAAIWANVGRIVYSVPAKQAAEKIGSMFQLSSEDLTTHSTNKPKLIGPLLQDEGIRVFE